jgi:hypothetical protein
MKTHSQRWLFEPPLPTQVANQEWLQENTPTNVTAPPLLQTESSPPQQTLYVNIPLGGENPAKPMTGIFIPANYRWQEKNDVILYLRGHHKGNPRETIKEYWNQQKSPHWAFREGINNSGKNVILIAPTLGPASQAGKLLSPGGFDRYLEQVLAALSTHLFQSRRSPDIGNIILACHSGGGSPMRQLASAGQRYTARIRECWGFDCLYNPCDEQTWMNWAYQRPDAKLYIHYGNGGTAKRSENLKLLARNLPNIAVEGSTRLGHNIVPITHWRNRILAAPFLNSK